LKNSPAGGSLGSPFTGYRFFQASGRLEYKMTNLNADEEARLLGSAYGAIALIGPNPNIGDQVSITLQGGTIASPQVVSATANAGDAPANLTLSLAASAAMNTVLQTGQVLAISPFGTGPFSEQAMPLAEIAFIAPNNFQLVNPSGTGMLFPQITATGVQLGPSASLDGVTTLWGYLAILDGLEAAYAGSSVNLGNQQAGPWKGRSNEAGQRLSLYKNWQIMLSEYLEIPLYEGSRKGYVSNTKYA
jgi:hypothetical protein